MVFIFLFFLEVSLDLHRGNSVSETAGTSLASKVMLRLCTPTAVGMVPFLVGELKKKKITILETWRLGKEVQK